MGIEVRLEGAEAQAASTKGAFLEIMMGLASLKGSIDSYTADTSTLKGMAFEASRQYQTRVIQPIIQVAKNYFKAVSEAAEKLPKAYVEQVDSKSWSEDELRHLIDTEQAALQALHSAAENLARLDIKASEKATIQARTETMIAGHEANLNRYQDLLQKLRDFDSYSATLFSDADDLKGVLQEALAQAKDSWDPQTHTFDASKAGYFSMLSNIANLTKSFSKEDLKFMQTLKDQYGFDDETAGQIIQVRKGLEKKFPNKSQSDIDYLLLRILGGTVYDGSKWDATAGGLFNDFRVETTNNKGEQTFREMTITEIFEELGLSAREAKQLNYNIRLQHELAGGKLGTSDELKNREPEYYKQAKENYKKVYGTDRDFDEKWDEKVKSYSNNGQGNGDFAHQAITTATILYNPSQTIQDLAGWRGDTTTDAGAQPSMKNDDYKADLDAVNLTERMKNGQSYFSASNDYYAEIASGKTNRAKEFEKNIDIKQAENTIYDSLVPSFSREVNPGKDVEDRQWSDTERAQYLRENYASSYNFLESVKNGKNDLETYDSNNDYESDKEK